MFVRMLFDREPQTNNYDDDDGQIWLLFFFRNDDDDNVVMLSEFSVINCLNLKKIDKKR